MPDTPPPKPTAGPSVIAACLSGLTAEPGVYRMLDAQGAVLYGAIRRGSGG
jgi:hypothetical protein